MTGDVSGLRPRLMSVAYRMPGRVSDPEATRGMVWAGAARPFNVNMFCHAPAAPDPCREATSVAGLADFGRIE